MRVVAEPNSLNRIELSLLTSCPFGVYGADEFRLTCLVPSGGQTLATEGFYRRDQLVQFSHELVAMHRDLRAGASASLWSRHANAAMLVSLQERGAVAISCIVTDADRNPVRGLHTKLAVDQTYLPEMSQQIENLSRQSDWEA